eukprot:6213913-Pleurochrysis_carterae.AAC.3
MEFSMRTECKFPCTNTVGMRCCLSRVRTHSRIKLRARVYTCRPAGIWQLVSSRFHLALTSISSCYLIVVDIGIRAKRHLNIVATT